LTGAGLLGDTLAPGRDLPSHQEDSGGGL